MKTLDEVIKSYEASNNNCEGCPYDDECLDHHVCECYERNDDALHYLKQFQRIVKILAPIVGKYEDIG